MEDLNETTPPADTGELIARIYRWNGGKITAAFLAALTEANYHALRTELEPIIYNHPKG